LIFTHRSLSEKLLASTGVPSLDSLLGTDGYPDRSAILILGPPGIGKEALGYWFAQSGLIQNDFVLYVTRLPVQDVLQEVRAFGVDFSRRVPFWFSSSGGQIEFDINDLAGLSFNIKDILKRNSGRRIRMVTDVIPSLLMLNPADVIYKYLAQLIAHVKQYDSVTLAMLEEGMHPPNVVAAMQQLFDGVIELHLYEDGFRVTPHLKIRKMRGIAPQMGSYNFSFSKTGMEIKAYAK